ncbi:MAG: hypothetical protein ACLFVR_00610 [Thiohalospira sp.]
MKIIRINNELHSAFKEMCRINKVTLTQGCEKLISEALKKGVFTEVKQNVFKKIQELDNTFRSWMRKHEKEKLDKITDDLLSLTRNLNGLGTKSDIENTINKSQEKIKNSYENLTNKFFELENYHKRFKDNLRKAIIYFGNTSILTAFIILVIIVLRSSLPSKEEKILELKIWEKKYEYLYKYCQKTEKSYEIEFLETFDKWLDTNEVKMINKLKNKGYVHQSDQSQDTR